MSILAATRSAAGASRASLLHLRIEKGSFAIAFAVVAGTCFVFAAMPRAFAGFAGDALRHEARAAGPQVRDISVSTFARIPAPAADPLAKADARARRELAALPPPLPALVTRRETLVETPRLALGAGPPGVTRYVTLRTLTGIAGHLDVVEGRLPHRTGETAAVTSGGGASVTVPVLEIALSRASARALHVRVGDRLSPQPDTGEVAGVVPPDVAARSVPGARVHPLVAQVVGLVRLRDPGGRFWFGDPRLATPVVKETDRQEYVLAYALASPDAYGDLLSASDPVPLRYEWRYLTDPDRFDADRAGAIRDAAARIEANEKLAGPLATRTRTGLEKLIDGYLADRSQAETLLAVAAIGLLACCVAVIALLAALGAHRRRRAVELMRTRGGSPAQVVGGRLAEGATLALPAAALGLGIALAVTDAGGPAFSGWLAATIAAATVAAFAAGAFALVRRPLETSPRDEVVLPRPSPRRLVLEALVVVAAAIGVYLVRRRGLEAEPSGLGFDPYLAAVPVLLGLGAALLVLRTYPLPLRLAARAAAGRRGLVAHLALGRAARAPAVGALPLVVLILALAIACFSAIALRSISSGQEREAWQRVGADLRVDGGDRPLPGNVRAEASAHAFVTDTFVASGAGTSVGPGLLAVEPDAYRHVLAGGPEADARRQLSRLGGDDELAAIAAGPWNYGDSVSLTFAGRQVRLHVVARTGRFPSARAGASTAVVSLPALQRALGERPVTPNRLYADGASRTSFPGARVHTREDALAQVSSAPLVHGTTTGLRLAVLLAALYAALAVVLSVVLTARSRSRDLAYLATLGLSSRQALGLAAGELAPLALVSAAAGAGLGIGVALLVAPGIDLSFFTGAPDSPLVLPSGILAGLAGGLVALVAVSALAGAALARRTDPSRALRLGDTT